MATFFDAKPFNNRRSEKPNVMKTGEPSAGACYFCCDRMMCTVSLFIHLKK